MSCDMMSCLNFKMKSSSMLTTASQNVDNSTVLCNMVSYVEHSVKCLYRIASNGTSMNVVIACLICKSSNLYFELSGLTAMLCCASIHFSNELHFNSIKLCNMVSYDGAMMSMSCVSFVLCIVFCKQSCIKFCNHVIE